MVNKNYIKGIAKEYRLKKKFEGEGNLVLRTAGSHGFADLVAIHPQNKVIKFIQAKPNSLPEKQRQKLLSAHSWVCDEWLGEFLVI